MTPFPCPNCGTELEVVREGYDGPPTAFKCAQCRIEFPTEQGPPSDVIDDPPPNAVCGCKCGCDERLTKGNAMAFTEDFGEEDAVQVLCCLSCYTGSHKTGVA